MTPLTVNPIVNVLLSNSGEVVGVSTNIAPDVKVVIAPSQEAFNDASKGMSFSTGNDK